MFLLRWSFRHGVSVDLASVTRLSGGASTASNMACNMRACGHADGGGSERGASCSVEPARSERGTQAQRRGATPAATSAAARARAKWHARAHAPSDAPASANVRRERSRSHQQGGSNMRWVGAPPLLPAFTWCVWPGAVLVVRHACCCVSSTSGLRHLSSAASPKAAAQGKRAAHAATPRAHTKPSNGQRHRGACLRPPPVRKPSITRLPAAAAQTP